MGRDGGNRDAGLVANFAAPSLGTTPLPPCTISCSEVPSTATRAAQGPFGIPSVLGSMQTTQLARPVRPCRLHAAQARRAGWALPSPYLRAASQRSGVSCEAKKKKKRASEQPTEPAAAQQQAAVAEEMQQAELAEEEAVAEAATLEALGAEEAAEAQQAVRAAPPPQVRCSAQLGFGLPGRAGRGAAWSSSLPTVRAVMGGGWRGGAGAGLQPGGAQLFRACGPRRAAPLPSCASPINRARSPAHHPTTACQQTAGADRGHTNRALTPVHY